MSDFPDNTDAQPEPPQRVESEIPLDTKLLSEAVIELNISRKNVGIYPPGHVQITNSIERTYSLLQKMFEIRPQMTLGIAKDTLLVGRDYLDRKNPVYRDLALSMSQQEIASVTFISGLEPDELVRFHRILTTKPEEIRASGGIKKVIADADIPHIRIQSIDYASFHVTEEEEIFKASVKTRGDEKLDSRVWEDFVSHLSAGTLDGTGQGVSVKDAEHIDPAELARLLNERKLDPNAAVESYDHIISSYVRSTEEKKQPTREQSQTLSKMNALMKDLHPDLRKQFLSVAFKNLSGRPGTSPDTEAVIGGFTDEMVIEMLKQASNEGREISPTLAGLVGKLAQAHTDAPAAQQRGQSKNPAKGMETPVFQAEQIQKLFDREKYEEYVSEDYQATLKQLTEDQTVETERAPLEEHVSSIEDDRLDFQIGRAMLAFMEENIDEEDYKEFAQKIVTLMPQLLETGNFEMIWRFWDALRCHVTDKPAPGIRDTAQETMKIFSDPEFIEKVLNAFDLWMRDKGKEAYGLIQALGQDTIPGLMDMYCREESLGGRRVLFDLLCAFRDPIVSEAHNRLQDPRTITIRNLLMLIGHAGNASSIPQIRPLLKHQNQMIKIDAIGLLLKFKDAGAGDHLRSAIHDKDPDFAFKAVAMAGQYRTAEVNEDVLSKIKRAILFETDYAENEEIIRVLGNIGDARSIADLEKLARATLSLYPKSLMRMKETIYSSLARYPRETLGGLIKIGEKLNSEKIRRTCKQLMEKQ